MDYFTTHYLQKGISSGRGNLLLFQILAQKYNKNLVFACVVQEERCEDDFYMIEKNSTIYDLLIQQFHTWFYGEALTMCDRRKHLPFSMLVRTLREVISQIELKQECLMKRILSPQIHYQGFFSVNREVVLFSNDRRVGYIKHRFLQPRISYLYPGNTKYGMIEGVVQSQCGILLATESFYQHLTEEQIKECLSVISLKTEEQANKHLKEAIHKAMEKGKETVGAILYYAVDPK